MTEAGTGNTPTHIAAMTPSTRALTALLRHQELCSAVSFIEDQLSAKLDSLRQDSAAILLERMPEDAYEDWLANQIEEWRYGDTFARTIRFSVFISAYSFLEADLDLVCREFENEGHKLRSRDLAGKGITRSQAYLEKVVQIDLSAVDWQRMSDLNAIRNCIAHAAGRVDRTDKAKHLRTLLPVDTYTWSGEDTIVLERGTLDTALNDIGSFWYHIWRAVSRR